MIYHGNFKSAMQSIRANKWRSLLTMLGIIVGVVSVVTTVSLGEGVKHQIRNQIKQRGQDLVTVLPDKRVERDSNGKITSYNPLSSGIAFAEIDYKTVQDVKQADTVVPFARVTGLVKANDRRFNGQVIATSGNLPELLKQDIAFGSFFDEDELSQDFAVIGPQVAEELFGENVPIGKSFELRDRSFIVRGIFEPFETASPLALDVNYNNTIFIPYNMGRELVGGNLQIQQLLVKPKNSTSPHQLVSAIEDSLRDAHGGQEDFTVLRAEENVALAGSLLDLITRVIAAIAAISLFVGGIGIMNIMLVSVTERTSEIGVRKAVGATSRQIMQQFLTEAVCLSVLGGLLGILTSVVMNFMLRVFTDLQPVITLPIIIIASLVSLAVGVVFGVTPALRAAHKDPIDSLRHP